MDSGYSVESPAPVVDPVEAMGYSVVVLACLIFSFAGLCFMCHHKYTTARRHLDADMEQPPPHGSPGGDPGQQQLRYAQPPPPLVPVHVAVISQPGGEYALGMRTRVDKKISE